MYGARKGEKKGKKRKTEKKEGGGGIAKEKEEKKRIDGFRDGRGENVARHGRKSSPNPVWRG